MNKILIFSLLFQFSSAGKTPLTLDLNKIKFKKDQVKLSSAIAALRMESSIPTEKISELKKIFKDRNIPLSTTYTLKTTSKGLQVENKIIRPNFKDKSITIDEVTFRFSGKSDLPENTLKILRKLEPLPKSSQKIFFSIFPKAYAQSKKASDFSVPVKYIINEYSLRTGIAGTVSLGAGWAISAINHDAKYGYRSGFFRNMSKYTIRAGALGLFGGVVGFIFSAGSAEAAEYPHVSQATCDARGLNLEILNRGGTSFVQHNGSIVVTATFEDKQVSQSLEGDKAEVMKEFLEDCATTPMDSGPLRLALQDIIDEEMVGPSASVPSSTPDSEAPISR